MTPTLLTKAQVSRYRALKQGKFRKQEGLFLLEGLRLCEEAFNSDLEIHAVITEKGFDKLVVPAGLLLLEANSLQLGQISDSKTPQGIICIAKIPDQQTLPEPLQANLILAMDRISDPGNLGTILRSALWFGVKHLLLGPGCVDPYNPKVVRSAMGATGRLQLHQVSDLVQSGEQWTEAGGQVAALHMDGEDLHKFKRTAPLMLVIGSEAHGVHADILSISDQLSITKKGRGESLNAAMATSIGLYELSKAIS